MSSKFNYDNFTITVDFKNDFHLAMTVSDNYTGDFFINESIELTKIKKETILATLSRKSESHLKCEFQFVDLQPRKLVLSFVVSFDFLPTFNEYITLDQIQNKHGMNKVQSAELRSDIEQLDKLISSIADNTSTAVIGETTHSVTQKTQIYSKQLVRGNYLVEISGIYVCQSAGIQKHDILFTIEHGLDKHDFIFCAYTNGGYGYPFCTRKQLVLNNDEKIKISAQNKNGLCTFQNTYITISPMLKLNNQ